MERGTSRPSFPWAKCHTPDELQQWVEDKFPTSTPRNLAEGMLTGLSRPPAMPSQNPLKNYITVQRGIMTGNNDFFLFTSQKIADTGIPPNYFIRVISRVQDITTDTVTRQHLHNLDEQGRPTYLLYLNGTGPLLWPSSLTKYVSSGEKSKIHLNPVFANRRPWFYQEKRIPPPFLFAYLGRRRTRFIHNEAGVVPLSTLLCLYPKNKNFVPRQYLDVLNHPLTIQNLIYVSKQYGHGALKTEPRALEKLSLAAALD